MWGVGRPWRTNRRLTCIACGTAVKRSEAREYDKYGDRWNRDGKTFEYLCKQCHRGLCHFPRDELEAVLVDVGLADTREEFLAQYIETVERRNEPIEERDR